MRICKLQNDTYPNFSGKVKINKPLKELKASLSPEQCEEFMKSNAVVESVNDGKVFVYKPVNISRKDKIVTIREIVGDKSQGKPLIFVDYHGENPLSLFNQLANWYIKSCGL